MLKARYRSAAIGLGALLITASLAWGAGNWSTYPVVGGQSYCISTVTAAGGFNAQGNVGGGGVTGQGQSTGGSICAQTVPAGPVFTGTEMIPADTQALNSAPPQTVLIPNALLGPANPKKNKIVGGDFSTNLWQRGTTPVSAASPTSAVMSADRWYAYSASTQMTVIKETGASDTTTGLYASMRVQRPSAQTGTGAVCVGQVLDKNAAEDFIGQNAIMSFSALAGANLSSSNSALTVTVAYYTASDSATPGTNTGTFASGTITGYTAAVAGMSGTSVGTVASGAATIPISTTWTRYSLYAPIPLQLSGTNVTGVGISICDTPVGTAGTNDWFEIGNVSLNAAPSAANNILAAGVTSPIGFERRPPAEEALYQLAYSYVLTDGAATLRYGLGQVTTTTNANVVLNFPAYMRETPATTVGTATSFGVTIAAGTAAACTTLAAVATSNTPSTGTLACTTSGVVAGNATQFTGAATGGLVTFSAEP